MITLQKSKKHKNPSNRVKITHTHKKRTSLQKSEYHLFWELTEGQLEAKELSLSELHKKNVKSIYSPGVIFTLFGVIFTRFERNFTLKVISLFLNEINTFHCFEEYSLNVNEWISTRLRS